MPGGYVQGWPRMLLRAEGAGILVCAILGYAWTGQPWWMFVALALVPDASMAGYLGGPRMGAAIYNMAHTLTPALLLLCAGLALRHELVTGMGLIWSAHIGADRMLGYGLKYARGFAETHLGPIGPRPV